MRKGGRRKRGGKGQGEEREKGKRRGERERKGGSKGVRGRGNLLHEAQGIDALYIVVAKRRPVCFLRLPQFENSYAEM